MKPFYYVFTCIPMNEWFLIYQQTLPKTARFDFTKNSKITCMGYEK